MVEAVVVITEEAAVEEDAGGGGREAAGEGGAGGGVAEEAIGVGEVAEALREGEHGRRRVQEVSGPVASGEERGHGFHFRDEGGDESGLGRGLRGAAESPGFGDSGIGERNGEEEEDEEDEEEGGNSIAWSLV